MRRKGRGWLGRLRRRGRSRSNATMQFGVNRSGAAAHVDISARRLGTIGKPRHIRWRQVEMPCRLEVAFDVFISHAASQQTRQDQCSFFSPLTLLRE